MYTIESERTICPTMNKSELARLLAQIEAEHQAAKRAMYDTAITAPHAVITARMESIGRHFESLAEIVGGELPAMALIANTLENMEENTYVK